MLRVFLSFFDLAGWCRAQHTIYGSDWVQVSAGISYTKSQELHCPWYYLMVPRTSLIEDASGQDKSPKWFNERRTTPRSLFLWASEQSKMLESITFERCKILRSSPSSAGFSYWNNCSVKQTYILPLCLGCVISWRPNVNDSLKTAWIVS